MHYNRWKRHGDPLHQWIPQTCEAAACSKQAKSLGYCVAHYTRVLRYGDPHGAAPLPPVRACAIASCTAPHSARGWCADHYDRWRRYGDPQGRKPGEVVNGCRICPSCGLDLPLADWSTSWCKQCQRERRRWHAHIRRQRIEAATSGEFFRHVDVFERDRWICGICNKKVDILLSYPHPMSKSLDHIVPLSKGGAHSFENCQTAHLRCNLLKRDS
ncbi:HNH endonuclease [Pimelobacter simplex]|uniref:HNH endonuclease n=1 Tax=Nocardioides simplex TaxID=2045 RepID=UPI003672D66F